VRALCPHCKQPQPVRPADWRALGVGEQAYAEVAEIYVPAGCERCAGTGYVGRVGIFEMLTVSEEMREAIHDGKGLHLLKKLAQKQGMPGLRQDGARHVAAGVTSIDEVLRVTREDSVVLQE